MATQTLTRGYGYWIQERTAYNNKPGSGFSGDWVWYIGSWHPTYGDDMQYGAGCVEFSVPELIDAQIGRTVTIPCKFWGYLGQCTALAVLSTTAPVGLEYRYGPISGVISNVVDVLYTDKSLTFTITDGIDISGEKIYLYLYQENNGYGGSGNAITTGSFEDATVTYTEGGIVYIGSEFEPYLAYIDNGTSWDLTIPHKEDGIQWNM